MKIAFINGSPKFKDSASGMLLTMAKEYLGEAETEEFICNKTQLEEHIIQRIFNADAILFSFPLYVDSIPSHLLRCMVQMQQYIEAHPLEHKPMVYTIVNNGFFDGKQNRFAIENIKHWSHRCGLLFGQGVGIGGGGMAASLVSIPGENGPKKNVAFAIKTMCDHITNRAFGEIIAVEPNFSRFAYRYMAQLGWRQGIKKNGLKVKDLSLQR